MHSQDSVNEKTQIYEKVKKSLRQVITMDHNHTEEV